MAVIVRAGLISEIAWSAGWLIDNLLTILENFQKLVKALKTCIQSVEKVFVRAGSKFLPWGGPYSAWNFHFFSNVREDEHVTNTGKIFEKVAPKMFRSRF